MALPKKLRRRGGTSGPAAGSVQVPLQQEDLKAAVEQLQASVNEVISRFNAHTHSAGAVAAPDAATRVQGLVVADTSLFTPPATT